MQQSQGLIAILDALGAASYTEDEISRFLQSRERVLGLLKEKAVAVLREEDIDIEKKRVSTFTFNDTILIVFRTENFTTSKDIHHFCMLLRKFEMDSLVNGILFRGALSIGTFHVNDRTNTVMGPAVTDAAGWYEAADWIGINATPHATLSIQSQIEQDTSKLDAVLVDYPVPLRDGTSLMLKAINWPKAFVVKELTPCGPGEDRRSKCLSLLIRHKIPKGTELKYFNSMKFFDHCMELWDQKANRQKS